MPAWYVKRSRTGLIATTDQVGADEYVAEPFASQDDALAWIERFKCRRETRRNVWGMVIVFALLAGVGLMGPTLVQAATSSFQPTINNQQTTRNTRAGVQRTSALRLATPVTAQPRYFRRLRQMVLLRFPGS